MEVLENILRTPKLTDDREVVDIIIPTYENHDMLNQCIQSIMLYEHEYPLRFIIVNNGENKLDSFLYQSDRVSIINPGKNIGWEGGLIEGLKYSNSKYVMFCNDDIFIPRASNYWLKELVRYMDKVPFLGAVGPSSNCVAGAQNMWHPMNMDSAFVSYLIGFCMLVRREALDKVGGIQIMEFGGDDIDLCMRLRKHDYVVACKKSVFIYHHGFVTGHRVRGTRDKPGGWNSKEMIENTNMELIRKHGFKEWFGTMQNSILGRFLDDVYEERTSPIDGEGHEMQKYINGGKVIELGCGGKKTVPHAIGVDKVPGGEMIPYENFLSVADVTADVSKDLPFEEKSVDTIIARHVFEHCLDPIDTLKKWRKPIKNGGNLIIACPNENETNGIPLNPNHLHAFTADVVRNMAELCGYKENGRVEDFNGNSFVINLEAI